MHSPARAGLPCGEMNNDTPHSDNSPRELRGRVVRLDRGWSTVELHQSDVIRVRNMGVEVAVGDEVLVSGDRERVDEVFPRRSALVRRASFEGSRATRDPPRAKPWCCCHE